MAISDEKTISVTTFRKSGDPVSTATWIVPLDGGRFGFWTSSASGKVKRLRNDPRVTVQPSNNRGVVKPGTTPLNGTAEVVDSGPDYDAVQSQVRAKYKALVPVTKALYKLASLRRPAPYGDLVVVVTPAD